MLGTIYVDEDQRKRYLGRLSRVYL